MAVIRSQIISGNPGHNTVPKVDPQQLPRSTLMEQPGNSYIDNWRSADDSSDKLITRDRHVVLSRGTENTGRLSGNHDAMLDGPARPSLVAINRTINQQQGFAPRNFDDLNRGYNKTTTGEWIGQQDGTPQPIYGGTPGLWYPYGGYGGITGGPVSGIQSPAPVGSMQDGPQKVKPGPPHGLHSATLPVGTQVNGRYMAIPQMVATSPSRPFNSKIAGQSYSQTVAPLGQTGTVAIRMRTAGTGARTVGYNPGSGWRGR